MSWHLPSFQLIPLKENPCPSYFFTKDHEWKGRIQEIKIYHPVHKNDKTNKRRREGWGSFIYRILPQRKEQIKFINDSSSCQVALKEIVQITGNAAWICRKTHAKHFNSLLEVICRILKVQKISRLSCEDCRVWHWRSLVPPCVPTLGSLCNHVLHPLANIFIFVSTEWSLRWGPTHLSLISRRAGQCCWLIWTFTTLIRIIWCRFWPGPQSCSFPMVFVCSALHSGQGLVELSLQSPTQICRVRGREWGLAETWLSFELIWGSVCR